MKKLIYLSFIILGFLIPIASCDLSKDMEINPKTSVLATNVRDDCKEYRAEKVAILINNTGFRYQYRNNTGTFSYYDLPINSTLASYIFIIIEVCGDCNRDDGIGCLTRAKCPCTR
jgi:hypothetical protein